MAGYALLFVGTSKLSDKSLHIAKSKPWAMGMTILAFLFYMGVVTGIALHDRLLLIWGVLSVLVRLYILYRVDMEVREIEQSENITLGAEGLLRIWKLQSVLWIMCSLLVFIPLELVKMILSLLALAACIAGMVCLVCFYRAKKRCDKVRCSG